MLNKYLADACFYFANLWQGIHNFGCNDMEAPSALV